VLFQRLLFDVRNFGTSASEDPRAGIKKI
jgi:hypothetical protein